MKSPRDLIGVSGGRARPENGLKHVLDGGEAEAVVKEIQQGSEARHLRKVDCEALLLASLQRHCRLTEHDAGLRHGGDRLRAVRR